MPAIEVRPAIASDIPYLMEFDHSYSTEFVWQMEIQLEPDRIGVAFRKTRLPRLVRQEYPLDPQRLADEWTQRSAVLVAIHESVPVGYATLMMGLVPDSALVADLAVVRRLRRQGIGTALVLAAQDWAMHHRGCQILLVMQSKNYPAICLAQKMGYDFCGYSDRYYPNADIALFFSKPLR